MKWEKVAQRENDFLKNCLIYEAFVEDFPKVFSRPYPAFLTIREGMSYTHCINKESSTKLAKYLLENTKKNPNYMKEMFNIGKKYFDHLIEFSSNIGDLTNNSNKQLLDLINEYFKLYKEPYPYFLITAEARIFEEENTNLAEEAINTMARLRLYGRSSFNKTHDLIYPLFEEIASRFGISVKELKFLTPQEIRALLEGKNLNIDSLIKDREKCTFIHINGNSTLHENCSFTIHDDEKNVNAKEIKGKGTFPAKYKGKVKLIKNIEDMNSLIGGEVIVLQMTTADLITVGLKKAGAIVTDEGGITCHAAIISREFQIPTVIGTEIATKVFNDGDLVEVDAEKGIVKKIN